MEPALLAEIKEISNHKSKEDVMLLSVAAVNRHPLNPHLEFEYPDHDIHEDLYKLIKYSCEKVCPSEQLDMIMRIWTTFIEPMIGVPSRPQISEAVEDVAIYLSKHDKSSNFGATGSTGSPTEIGSLTGPKEHRVVDMSKNSESPSPLRPCDDNADEGFEMKTRNDPQDGDYTRKLLVSPEREGVELPPNDILRGCGENSEWSAVTSKEIYGGRQDSIDRGVGDTYGVQAEEYAHKTLEESDIAFKMGLVSGTEKANKEVRLPLALKDEGSQDTGSNRELERMSDAQGGERIIVLPPCSKHPLPTAKPVTKWIPKSNDKQHESQIFYGNDPFYVFLRLHHILYERILKAKLYSSVAESKKASKRPLGVDDYSSTNQYARFMNTLYNLLEGSIDNAKYKDDCRANFGARSYPLFMLDKLIFKIIKQLQNIAADETCNNLLQLHEYETSRKPGRFNDECYADNAHVILQDENTYRIECTITTPTRLTIQVMDYRFDEEDATAVSMHPKTAAYLEDFLAEATESRATPGVYMKRNKRKYAHLDETSAFMEAYEGLLVSNGLVKKISGRPSRGLSVLGSEDFMMRRKRRKSLHQNGNGHAGSSNGLVGFSLKKETHAFE